MIRLGYVSNSSSSSFCVLTRALDEDEDMLPDRAYMGFIEDCDGPSGEGGQILLELRNPDFIRWADSPGRREYIRKRYNVCEVRELPYVFDAEFLEELRQMLASSPGKSWVMEHGDCDQNSITCAADFESMWREYDSDYDLPA